MHQFSDLHRMDDSNIQQIVYSKNVIEFVTVASEYCASIEQANRFTIFENIDKLRKLLPLLYLKTSVLPKSEPVLDDELERFLTELDYNVLHQKLLLLLKENDSFYEVFDPEIQFGQETVTASISESLMDIYQDLKDFLTAYSIGNEEVMHDALVQCELNFEEYWGQQLLNVLRALHKLQFGGVDLQDDEKNREEDLPGKGNPNWLDKFWGTDEDEA